MDTKNKNAGGKAAHESFFTTDRAGLRRRTISGGIATAVGQAFSIIFHFASIATLARCLAPSDFGLVGMVVVVTGFITLFGDSGLSAATVQRPTITHEQVSTLFWINAGLGVVLMIITIALAPVLAWFYNEPRLTGIAIGTATGFLFRGLGVQHSALLRRNLQFTRLVMATVTGSLVGYGLGVWGALQGCGYWSLVIQAVGTSVATVIALWIACRWRPGAFGRFAEVKAMVGFGSSLTGSTLLNYLLRNFDNLLIGWYWGPAVLGLYTRAYALMMLPMSQLNGPINQVATPGLSRVSGEPEKFKEAYFKAVTLIASISLPASLFLLACAEPFIMTVMGEQWREMLPIFVALAPAAALSTLTNSVGWVYNSMGTAGRQLKWTVFAVPIYLGGFIVALPFGATAVAASFSILLLILFLPTFAFAFRGTALSVRLLLGVLWRPVTAGMAAGVISWLVIGTAGFQTVPALTQLAGGAVTFAIVYAAAWFSLPGGKTQVSETWRYIACSRKVPRPKEEAVAAAK